MLAILTGIPGTGKTTVAKKALDIIESEGIEYEMVTYGDVMFEIAKSKNLVQDRDEMRKLKPDQQKEIQKDAAKSISEKSGEGNVLVDTHCTISTPKGYLPGLPEWVLSELKPNAIIIVESKAEEIAGRRQKDKTRVRDEELTEGIRLHQELNRDIAMAYSVLTGATVKIIENPEGQIEKAAGSMVNVLK